MKTVRNRGFQVVPIDATELAHIYDLRTMLEIPAMTQLAGLPEVVRREAEFGELADQMVRAAADGDIVRFQEADRNFHVGLISILGNRRLTTLVENLRDQSRNYGFRSLWQEGTLVRSADEHRPILDAIVQGKKTLVTKLMTRHLTHLFQDWAGKEIRSEGDQATAAAERINGVEM